MDRYRIPSKALGTASSHISLPPKPHLPATTGILQRAAADDGFELSIFDAQRYFNDLPSDRKPPPPPSTPSTNSRTRVPDHCSSISSLDGLARNWRSSLYATPTASSEASWNSQSGLLTNPPGSISVSVKAFPNNNDSRKSHRRLFGRACPCSGEKSVTIEPKPSEPKSPARHAFMYPRSPVPKFKPAEEVGMEEDDVVTQIKIVPGNWRKEGDFFSDSGRFSPKNTFPTELAQRILKPNVGAGAFSFPVLNSTTTDDPSRVSLEVFRPSEELRVVRKTQTPELHLHRRTPSSPRTRAVAVATVDDDVASDTSSDLFEIESFSTQYRRKDSLEEARMTASCAANGIVRLHRSIEEEVGAPSECYAPSEVSVEWSVTTAEGFDRGSVANFSSAASEFDELWYAGAEHDRLAAANAGKKRGNGLLSCRCEKAVSVGPIPVKYAPEHRRSGGAVLVSVADGDGGGVMGRLGGWNEGKERPPVLSHCYSSRVTRPRSTR